MLKFTEEKLGKAERTESDPNFEILARRTDKIKSYTEKLVKDEEAVLVPNPGKFQKIPLLSFFNASNIKRMVEKIERV